MRQSKLAREQRVTQETKRSEGGEGKWVMRKKWEERSREGEKRWGGEDKHFIQINRSGFSIYKMGW